MVTNPRPGQMIMAWYKDKSMPYHGKVGRVLLAGKGRPRNHLVEIDGVKVVIPAGNLRKELRMANWGTILGIKEGRNPDNSETRIVINPIAGGTASYFLCKSCGTYFSYHTTGYKSCHYCPHCGCQLVST